MWKLMSVVLFCFALYVVGAVAHSHGYSDGYADAKKSDASVLQKVEARHTEIEDNLVGILNHLELYWRSENKKLTVDTERWPVDRYLNVRFTEDGIPEFWNLNYPEPAGKDE